MLGNCRDEPSSDAVHDLRVSIRRYLAAIEALSLLAKEPIAPKNLRPSLKGILDSYDELRDLDVMIADLGEHAELFGQNSLFFQDLLDKELDLRQRDTTRITDEIIRTVSKAIDKTERRATKKLEKSGPKQIDRTLDMVFQKCVKLAGKVNKDLPSTIHRLRIGFKKFRYSMELFSANLSNPPEDLFQRLRVYQTALGSVQDASVLIAVMDTFERRHPSELRLEEREFANTRLRTRIDAFLVLLPDLDHFWRKDKDHEQPWLWEPSNKDLQGFIERLKIAG